MNHELKKAIDQICKDKAIDQQLLVETLEDAVRTAVQRRLGEDIEAEVTYNQEDGEIEVYQFKIVVADGKVENPDREIGLAEARVHDSSVQLDDEMGFRVKMQDLGRIAAQSAKQVIIQRLRDAEQANIYNDYKERVGEIVSGTVQRRDKSSLIINLDRTEAILPRDEQISKEHYRRGESIQALVIEVHREGRGPQVVLSRSHPDYITALFHREVPEVDEGIIQIMGVARDPGSRAKVAVYSREREVDPVGACVGVRGARIQNIVQELRGERIDIVIWNPDIATYARNALAPALVSRIVVDEPNNQLEVIVPDDQLTNAIGRKGQNVKLAARLLGWKVDIFTESRYSEANTVTHSIEQLASVAELPVETLLGAGYTDMDKVKGATDEELAANLGVGPAQIDHLRRALNFLARREEALAAEGEQGS